MPADKEPALEQILGILVHHRHFPGVIDTIASMQASGLAAQNIVVVDNSEDPSIADALAGALPRGVNLLIAPNEGYAAAVNRGIDWGLEVNRGWVGALVCTHEVRLAPSCVAVLAADLAREPEIGVAGPVLWQGDQIWSSGGRLTRLLRLPRHNRNELVRATSTDWLDGAVNLYRWGALVTNRPDEIFFLYFEEVDLHMRIKAAGYRVVCEPRASAHQTSSGIPEGLHGRNLLIHERRYGRPGFRWLAVTWQGGIILVRRALRRSGSGAIDAYWRGVGQGLEVLREGKR